MISIVIPTYNNLDYLKLCLKSLKKNSSFDHEIIIHITGDEKRKVLDKALAGTDAAEIPVRIILNQAKVPVTVFWSP